MLLPKKLSCIYLACQFQMPEFSKYFYQTNYLWPMLETDAHSTPCYTPNLPESVSGHCTGAKAKRVKQQRSRYNYCTWLSSASPTLCDCRCTSSRVVLVVMSIRSPTSHCCIQLHTAIRIIRGLSVVWSSTDVRQQPVSYCRLIFLTYFRHGGYVFAFVCLSGG